MIATAPDLTASMAKSIPCEFIPRKAIKSEPWRTARLLLEISTISISGTVPLVTYFPNSSVSGLPAFCDLLIIMPPGPPDEPAGSVGYPALYRVYVKRCSSLPGKPARPPDPRNNHSGSARRSPQPLPDVDY